MDEGIEYVSLPTSRLVGKVSSVERPLESEPCTDAYSSSTRSQEPV